ncbi:MAG: class I SAM-dependent methyltransferase [Anaerolineaceae bacterium]|nr:class I SAM-dependent methyltransferase [Anaerolineaceae bacterium]
MIKKWLAHPTTKRLDIDSPGTTELRKSIIKNKPFLYQIYQEWYSKIIASLPFIDGPILELGSGAGFIKEYLPDAFTSEIFFCQGISAVLDGQNLPFGNCTLRAIVMTDVFHHIPNPASFLEEATRCIKPGGVISMIEPWVTPLSLWIYQRFHSEPVNPDVEKWEFPEKRPLSGANQAIPWVIFQRDLDLFHQKFPEWKIIHKEPYMPFRYLLSGGVSLRSLMPGWSFRFWRFFERALSPWVHKTAMFAHIVLYRGAVKTYQND